MSEERTPWHGHEPMAKDKWGFGYIHLRVTLSYHKPPYATSSRPRKQQNRRRRPYQVECIICPPRAKLKINHSITEHESFDLIYGGRRLRSAISQPFSRAEVTLPRNQHP